MSNETRLMDLLLRWEEMHERGEAITPEQLCQDSPELLEPLRARLAQLAALDPLLSPTSPGTESEHPAPAMRYLVVRPHARGGLGEVFVAQDVELNRKVALKQMQPHFVGSVEYRRRFLQEAEVTGRLEHPGIVPVYGLGVDGQRRPFYAMRFIEGKSLQDEIETFHRGDVPDPDQRERSLALRSLLRRFVDVCNAVGYAHSRGILHRDIKPANVMLGRFGETLVVDWGLACTGGWVRGLSEGQLDEEVVRVAGDEVQTQFGAVVGTPGYMSPEQITDGRQTLTPASDVYSLGATLYQLLTGHPPFDRAPLEDLLMKVQLGDFPSPRARKANVPAALEAVCQKAMALRCENRYATATELAADVEAWLADEPVKARPEPLTERSRRWLKRHRTLASVGVTTLLLMAGAWALLSTSWQREATALLEAERDRVALSQAEVQAERERSESRTKLATEEERAKAAGERARQSEASKRQEQYAGLSTVSWRAWQEGQIDRIPQLLRELPLQENEDLRGFEWHALRRMYAKSQEFSYQQHTARITNIAFTPNGKVMATASNDGTVVLWDCSTRRPTRTLIPNPDDMTGNLGVDWAGQAGHVVVAQLRPTDSAWLDGRLEERDQVVALIGTDGKRVPMGTAEDARRQELGPPGSLVTLEVQRRGKQHRFTLIRRRSEVVPKALTQNSIQGGVHLAFSPDGRHMVTTTGTVLRVWDVARGEALRTFPRPKSPILNVVYSPDGKHLATAHANTTTLVWDVTRATSIASFRPPLPIAENEVRDPPLAFTPDGKTLLASPSAFLLVCDVDKATVRHAEFIWGGRLLGLAVAPDGLTLLRGWSQKQNTLEAWDLTSERSQGYLFGHKDWVNALAITGNKLISGSSDHTVKVWDLSTRALVRTVRGHRNPVTAVAPSPDGGTLFTGDSSGRILVHDLRRDPETEDYLPGSYGVVYDFALTPDNRTLFVGVSPSEDNPNAQVVALDVPSGEFRGMIHGPVLSRWEAIAFLPDGKTLLSGEAPLAPMESPSPCRLFDLATGNPVGRLAGLPVTGWRAAVTGKGAIITSSGGNSNDPERESELIFWDPKTLHSVRTLRPHRGPIDMAISNDGSTLATFGVLKPPLPPETEVQLWDVATGKPGIRIAPKTGPLVNACLSPNGKLAVTATGDLLRWDLPSTLQLWDTTAGKELGRLTGHPNMIQAMAFGPDGKTVWTSCFDKKIRSHEVPSGKLLDTSTSQEGPVLSLALTPDGKRLAAGVGPIASLQRDSQSQVRVFQTSPWKEVASYPLRSNVQVGVRYSPDGRTLAAGSSGGELRLWDVATGNEQILAPLPEELPPNRHTGAVTHVAVSPDGKTLATGSWDRTIKLWDILPTGGQSPVRLRSTIPADGVVSCLGFSPDSKTLAWGTGGLMSAPTPGELILYDLSSNKVKGRRSAKPAGVTALAFSPDGTTVAGCAHHMLSVDKPGELFFVDVQTGEEHARAHRGSFISYCLAYTPDGKHLAFDNGGGAVQRFDLAMRKVESWPGHDSLITSLAFAPDGRTLATSSRDGTARLWHVATGRELVTLPHGFAVEKVAFSAKGPILATGSSAVGNRGMVRLWRVDAEPALPKTRTWFSSVGEGYAQRNFSDRAEEEPFEEAFFDQEGKPARGPDGYHRRWERTTNSRRTRERATYDETGKPLGGPGGYARSIITHNGEGQVERLDLWDDAGNQLIPEVVIVRAVPGGAGAKLDLQAGDVILRYLGKPVWTSSGFIASRKADEAYSGTKPLVVRRNEKEITVEIPAGLLGLQFENQLRKTNSR